MMANQRDALLLDVMANNEDQDNKTTGFLQKRMGEQIQKQTNPTRPHQLGTNRLRLVCIGTTLRGMRVNVQVENGT
jgi:hypothetical protein